MPPSAPLLREVATSVQKMFETGATDLVSSSNEINENVRSKNTRPEIENSTPRKPKFQPERNLIVRALWTAGLQV